MLRLSNPEVIRNVRAQLRPDRMLAVGAMCAVLSLAVGFSLAYARGGWGLEFLRLAVGGQAFVLLIMGGLAAVQAIQWEKQSNTFDFQRLTRLSSFELSVGKLLGAPLFAYFIALCLMPAAIVGAVAGHARVSFMLAGYAALILGAIAVHAFGLLLSLIAGRGAGAASAVLFLLGLLAVGAVGGRSELNLGQLSPFVAVDLVGQTTWGVDPLSARVGAGTRMTDLLFGWPVHHAPVLIVLYATFAAWLLLPVVRNIKRDPAVYEIFTPGQALGFGLYINLIAVAFLRWSDTSPLEAQAAMLVFNLALFSGLGLALLRTRERVRWLRERGREEAGWAAVAWPAPAILAGTLVAGLGVVTILEALPQRAEWDLGLALLRMAFLAVWAVRDVLFVQWMNLRGGRRPVLMSLLYLGVFYACATLIVTPLRFFQTQVGAVLHAVLIPGAVLGVPPNFWADGRLLWVAGLAVAAAPVGVLVTLERRALADLTPRRRAAGSAA